MGIPQFHNEGPDQAGGSASMTVNFAGFTWSAGDIIELVVATDGWVPVLTTANGFAIAADPQGNTASQTTNGGVAGTADCGIFVFWKRAVGSTTATDPEPLFQAPSVQSGTSWCLQPNSFSGARTVGTPYHSITKSTVTTATTAVTSTAASSTLANCLFMPRVASANDDSAFNNWTMTGSAGPSGTGAPNTGWHNNNGNACSFTGDEGGFAAATSNVTATTTFAASTKQALVTLVMASVNEFELDESSAQRAVLSAPPQAVGWLPLGDELVVTTTATLDDDVGPLLRLSLPPQVLAWTPSGDEVSGTALTGPSDEDAGIQPAPVVPVSLLRTATADDELPGTTTAPVDEDGQLPPWLVSPAVAAATTPAGDEIAGITQPTGIDEDATLVRPAPAVVVAAAALPVATEELASAVTSGIGGASDAQRSFLAPPQTGTLNTVAPLPAWATSTAYVVDPSQGGLNRVQNGGNHYQCSTGGTSASSGGGPTGTGTAITDGGVTWRYLGPVQTTNTAAGSQILCTVMRGNESQAATVQPTDNDSGGTYTLITDNEYTNFTGSFAGVWRRPTASNTKTNFQASGVWGGSGGAGDEMSIGWVELQGVAVGAPHTFSHVERLASSGGTVTAAAITTTVPCIIVSYWFGNGTVQAAGQPDAATPAGGLTLIAGSSGFLSLTTSGYVQHMVAWRKQSTPASNFAEVWTASPTDQGAQLVTIAFQDLGAPATISVEDDQPSPPARVVATVSAFQLMPAPDELALTTVEDDAAVRDAVVVAPGAMLVPVAADDEQLPSGALGDGESPLLVQPAAPLVQIAVARADDDLPPPAIVDEDGVQSLLVSGVPTALAQRPDAEELPITAAATVVDEDGVRPVPPAWPVIQLPFQVQADEIAQTVVASIVDEDGPPPPAPLPPIALLAFPVQVDEIVVATAAALDEDSQLALLLATAACAAVQLPQADEVIPAIVDDAIAATVPVVAPVPFSLRLVPEDEFQGVFTPPPSAMIDEDRLQPTLPWQPPPPGFYLMAVDELAIALAIPSLTKHVQIVNGGGPIAAVVNGNGPVAIIVEEPRV